MRYGELCGQAPAHSSGGWSVAIDLEATAQHRYFHSAVHYSRLQCLRLWALYVPAWRGQYQPEEKDMIRSPTGATQGHPLPPTQMPPS